MTEQDSIETRGDGDQPWTPAPAERYASVWPHTLGDYEKWPDAVGVILDSGALVIRRAFAPATTVPLKIYAPGAWMTIEHVGDYTTPPPPPGTPPVRDRIVPRQEVDPESTGEMPKYRDPVEQLDPDLLDAENGDVNHRSGVGVLVPRQLAPAPGFGTADPGEGGAAPKAVTAAEPTAGDPDDTDVSVARFVLGVSLDRPRRWLQARPWQRRPRSLDQMLGGTPTHLLSAVLPTSRATWWLLAGLLPLLALVLTTR